MYPSTFYSSALFVTVTRLKSQVNRSAKTIIEMSLNRQLSELSASELNDAIDDTNFPQAHVLSRGRNNSVCSTSSAPATVLGGHERRTFSYSDDGTGGIQLTAELSAANSESGLVGGGGGGGDLSNSLSSIPSSTGGLRGPHLSLKMNGIGVSGAETEPSTNGSTTPTTPRTSQTPGSFCSKLTLILLLHLFLS